MFIDRATTSLTMEQLCDLLKLFFKNQLNMQVISVKAMKAKLGYYNGNIAWALSTAGVNSMRLTSVNWNHHKVIELGDTHAKMRWHEKSCALLGLIQSCAHWANNCPCAGSSSATSAFKPPKPTKDDVIAQAQQTRAEHNNRNAQSRISNAKMTKDNLKCCQFYLKGFCTERTKSSCPSGAHPTEANLPDGIEMPKCAVPDCNRNAECPFTHPM